MKVKDKNIKKEINKKNIAKKIFEELDFIIINSFSLKPVKFFESRFYKLYLDLKNKYLGKNERRKISKTKN